MNVLYVTGACLTRNTSANMSHNAFVQGLLENGCDVDIVMAKDSWGDPDQGLPVWEKAKYHVFSSLSLADWVKYQLRGKPSGRSNGKKTENNSGGDIIKTKPKFKATMRSIGKRAFYSLFKKDPVYPLEKQWLKKAVSFKSEKQYDLVVSNSSPAASHRLVVELKKRGSICFSRWIQIWEDPWFHDLYGKYPRAIEEEEHYLLKEASEIVYVSPLTLMYQKKFFPDCAHKMRCIPLPALQFEKSDEEEYDDKVSFGYFGDYYSEARNIVPFYNAVKHSDQRCYIYGDSDLALKITEKIEVSGRVTLDKLKTIQSKTRILVHLSNIRGGQIPGKIYHYSVTNKPILFILDGTEEEQQALREYFEPFMRYIFCSNTTEDIYLAIEEISKHHECIPVLEQFLPKNVVYELLMKTSG